MRISKNRIKTLRPLAADPHFNNVSLLMPYEGNNNDVIGTTISASDGSSFNNVVSGYSGVSLSSSQSKFGTTSVYFDGTSSAYFTIPASTNFQFGGGDFTIEAWIYLPVTPSGSYAAIVDIRGTAGGAGAVLFALTSSRNLRYYSDANLDSTGTVPLNQWTHVALVRSSNVVAFYINGTQSGTVNDGNSKGQLTTIYIGRVFDNAHPAFNGFMNDLRITKGVARYTSNFSVPTQSFSTSDIYFNSVSLLLQFRSLTTKSSLGFLDRSKYGFTATGLATIKTEQYKFGKSSLYIGGNNSVDFPSNAAFNIGTNDFTFECWAYVIDWTITYQTLFNIGSYNSGMLFRFAGNGNIQYYGNNINGNNFNTASTINTNTWYHVAISRNSGNVRVFLNGIQQGSTLSDNSNIPQGAVKIGVGAHNSSEYLKGYIDDLRFTNGVGRYTSNFTPPSSFVDFTGASYKILSRQEADPFYENVSLLLKMDGANGSTTFTDSSPTPKTVTRNGSVIISNARINPRIGVTSAYFDGDGDFLSVSNNSDFSFGTSDCTIECWIYIVSTPPLGNGAALFTNWDGTSGITLKLAYADFGGGPSMRIMADRGGNAFGPSIALSLNTWYHVAFIKTSSGAKVFVNGVGTTFETPYNHNLTSAATNIQIGKFITPAITQLFNGYIDDLRVTKGVARYTSNFTVPNESFPDFDSKTFRMTRAQSTTFSMNELSQVDFNTTATIQLSSIYTMNELSQVDFNTTATTSVALTMTG